MADNHLNKSFDGARGLRVEHARPKPLEFWWKPGRGPAESGWFKLFMQLPSEKREALIKAASDGVIYAAQIVEEAKAHGVPIPKR